MNLLLKHHTNLLKKIQNGKETLHFYAIILIKTYYLWVRKKEVTFKNEITFLYKLWYGNWKCIYNICL